MSDTTSKAGLLDDSAIFTRTIDTEAMKRFHAEVEARIRAEAEQKAVAAQKETLIKKTEPEPTPRTLSIREFLDNAPIKSGNARLLALCQKHGIDIDKNPWPPNFPKENESEPPKAEQKGQLVLFPEWADTCRATAQAIFRSALFPALNNKQPRRYLEQERIASVEGVTVFFTGKQFDQSDLDVYLELLQIARESPFGIECSFTAYGLLKAIGHATGNKDHKWLHSVLIRLRSGTVDMTDHGIRYFGGLIEGGIKDEITRHYTIRINPEFARFFKAGLWASLDIEQRRSLGRNQTAKALHAYYSTHAAPGPHTYEKLAEIAGLNGKNRRDVKAIIIRAHAELKRIGFLSAYEVGLETIKVKINHTPSQTRHIMRKIVKSKTHKKKGQTR